MNDRAYGEVARSRDRAGIGQGLEDWEVGSLAAEFAKLTSLLLAAKSVADVLGHVVEMTQWVVPAADLVSVTLRAPDGRFHTPVKTSALAVRLDEIQYETGEGPCVTAALATGPGHVSSDDCASEPAWPTFGPAAADLGFVAVLATALLPDASPPQLTGALNIYMRRSGALDEAARDRALLLSTYASLALSATHAATLAELRETNLRRAIETRDVIGQAKGILMYRRGLTADAAFELLRKTSVDLNIKLVDLATTISGHHLRLD